ncbi:hypothetical protein BH11MYX1_BH11MYX1_54860 [soil metagenome]
MRAPLLTFCAACSAHAPRPVIQGNGGAVATRDTRIDGWARFPIQHVDDPALKGKVRDLTSEAEGNLVKWTLAVEDNTDQRHSYVIDLPPEVALPIATGTTVTVTTETVGGGPGATGHIAVVDADNTLLLAIGILPVGWSAEPGGLVSTTPGDPYDEQAFAVRVVASDGHVDLVPTPWRSFDLAGSHYLGNGTAVQRELHGNPAPPDYVGAWTDFNIVREP